MTRLKEAKKPKTVMRRSRVRRAILSWEVGGRER
jgi:hypothetical protein